MYVNGHNFRQIARQLYGLWFPTLLFNKNCDNQNIFCTIVLTEFQKIVSRVSIQMTAAPATVDFKCEERLSESPLVDLVWYSHGEYATQFISMAQTRWSLVIASIDGKITVGIHGPETKASRLIAPANAEFLSIMFKIGTVMPQFPLTAIRDMADITFPNATNNSFWLGSRTWQLPNMENIDVFISQLAREGLLTHDKVVADTLKHRPMGISLRSVQRRFKQATGLTYGMFEQINRARYATKLLKNGKSTLAVVAEAGYYDQSHLIRSLKRFVGLSPQEIIAPDRNIPLSFLYNTPLD